VEVFNAGAPAGTAHVTGAALTAAGYNVSEIGDAPNPLVAGSPTEIWYSATGLEAAHTLGASLSGTVKYVPDPALTGNTVALFLDTSPVTVKGSTTTTTTTTTPGSTTTTTTIPADVYTNTQAEPWNPVPCTLGAGTQASKS